VRCGLEKMSENPVMTSPIMKRINTEFFIEERAELYKQKGEPNFLAKLKRVKCWCQDHQEVGTKKLQ